MDVSRRDFFKSIIPRVDPKESIETNRNILILGHLTIFPVHSSRAIKLMETELVVESLPEGIRLRDILANENIKLSLNSSGLIQAHLNEFWPPTAVLSVLTGEIYNI